MTTVREGTRIGLAGAAASVLAAALLLPVDGARAQAQDGVDARWLPWLGCWTETGGGEELLCIRPASGAAGAGGIELVAVREGEVAETSRLRADGVARETTREGCTGTERAAFSSDGHRVYLRSDFVCEGEVDREGTGLIAMVSPSEWIRVETVEVAGETAAVTRRYGEATAAATEGTGLEDATAGREMAVRSARRAAASRPSVEDLVEASEQVDPEAVRTWVAEQDRPLEVDAVKLARLADAGVPEEVIDVVVAVSFPERFALDRDARGRRTGGAGPAYRGRFGSPYGGRGTFYRDPFFYGYTPFGYGYGRYGWWYGSHRPTVVIVTPRGDDGGGGRVVNGRGYTRGNSSAPQPADVRGAGTPSRGSVTPSGATSGGSGSTGRKAKPREGGSSGDGGSPDGGA
jgi:hypothetical protein